MKDFQTVTAAAADRIGGFFAGLRTRITERTDEGDGARIARILRRFFAASACRSPPTRSGLPPLPPGSGTPPRSPSACCSARFLRAMCRRLRA